MTHHLAILKERYLDPILRGSKTVECRLSRTRRPPFGLVSPGDTLWLKRSGGCVVATARVRRVEYLYPVVPETLQALQQRYGSALQAQLASLNAYADARFATIIELDAVSRVEPVRIAKSDRRAWVVLTGPLSTATRANA